MNNDYTIVAEAPLLRAGLTIVTTGSEKYAVRMVKKMLEIIREINKEESA